MFGPYSHQPRPMNYYRCANCNPPLNLPAEDAYRRCPQCGTPTAHMSDNASTVMSLEAAAKLASHAEFLRRLDNETEDERLARRAKLADREKADQERLASFDAVLAAAGFEDWELARFADGDKQLAQFDRAS